MPTDSKTAILQATEELIDQNGDRLEDITVREICRRANVGLGLVNYYFGSKEALIAQCVERKIQAVVAAFQTLREQDQRPPFETLEYCGELTFDFLFAHEALSRISILSDMQHPKEYDNTHRTFEAYLPLVAACRPDWDEQTVREKTFSLITVMQQAFLRRNVVHTMLGIDLNDPEQRRTFHTKYLRDLLEE